MRAERLIFVAASTVYLAVAAVLVGSFHVVTAQALGVTANASYVIFSRDPHLAAIGFVTSPLPSLLVLPLLPLQVFWPALSQQAVAANIVSSLFVAGAVYQLYRILRERAAPRWASVGITVLFAVHPLVIWIAATGTTESVYLFFLVLAARHLMRWLYERDTMGEVVAGFALAGAYLARYDAALLGAAAVLVVLVVSWRRASRSRGATAISDAVIVGGPLAATIGLWAAGAWLVTGDPFPQLTSAYGYVAQLHALRSHVSVLGIEPVFTVGRAIVQLVSLEPALPGAILLLLVTMLGSHRRERVWLLAVLLFAAGGILAANLGGWAFPWLRVAIVIVPLVSLVVGLGLVPRSGTHERPSSARSLLSSAAAFAVLVAAIPTTIGAMLSPWTGLEESAALRTILHQTPVAATTSPDVAAAVAAYLDRHRAGDGTVLVDSFTGFPVILASTSPRQFLITSDRDFGLALSNPQAFGVRYLLVPEPATTNYLGSIDAINRAYPHLFDAGAGSGGLAQEFLGPGRHVAWRLYRVSILNPTAVTLGS